MQNPILFKALSGISFVISALFTIFLMLSGVNGIIASTLTVGVAVILEFSKVMFFTKAVQGNGISFSIRAAMFIISGLLFISSIMASLSFLQNQNNETRNKAYKNSVEYKQMQENRQQQQVVMNQKQGEIDQLKQQAQELPRNYYSMKQQIMDKVASKTKELEGLTQQLQEIKPVTGQILDQKGYTAFMKVVADWINSTEYGKESPVTVDGLEALFFGMIAVIFELVAGLLFYLSQVQPGEAKTLHMTNSREIDSKGGRFITTYKPKTLTGTNKGDISNVSNKIIGFQMKRDNLEPEGYNREDLKRYLEYMYSTLKGNVSLGYRTIGQAINIDQETARKIKGALEQKGIIETVGNKTLVIRNRQEAII